MSTSSTDLSALLWQILALDPAAGAIEFQGHWLSWGELEVRARDLVSALDDSGLSEGAAVGLLLRNDPAMVAAVVGVIASRRCVVTLNPHQGGAKLARDIRELRLPVIVGSREDWQRPEVVDAVRDAGTLGLCIDLDEGLRAVPGCEVRQAAADHESLPGTAVQMLTSGTTGPPKRVQLGFSAIERSLLGAGHYERSKENTPRLRTGVAIINAPLVHVGGLWRVLQCLADGRSFALLERFELKAWCDLVKRHRPRTVSLVPAALRMVLDADIAAHDLESIVAVISGTAPLPPEQADRFEAKYGIPVLTTYGATEFAGGVAGWNLDDHHKYRVEKRGSVGRAHPGCELRVVDPESHRVLAAGEPGILEVRSAQLGPDSDWVRTTDLATLDGDGFLFILGRADSAILRGGFKIHPDELRAVLEAHPAVLEAAVVGLPDDRLGHVPVAAVTLREAGPPADEESLREYARQHLASYQVPARIRVVDQLPRTPSLKVSQPDVIALFDAPPTGGDGTELPDRPSGRGK